MDPSRQFSRLPCRFWPATFAAAITVMAAVVSVVAAPLDDFGGFGGLDEDIVTARGFVSHTAVAPGGELEGALRLEMAQGWHVNSHTPYENYLIPTALDLKPPTDITVGPVDYPAGHDFAVLGEKLSVYESGTVLRFAITTAPDIAPGVHKITGTLKYQPCDSTSCRAPADLAVTFSVTVDPAGGEPQHADIFTSATGDGAADGWELDTGGGQEPNEIERLVAEYGNWGYVLAFLLAYLTGVLLSFSPCTYPMIPITVSIFAGQARGPGKGFMLSLVYVLTMAAAYGIMGSIVASIGGVFGAWLAHPAVVWSIVAIFVVFSLSMFGLYELQAPAFLRNKLGSSGGEGFGGALVLGLVAALVISPCVGPFVAGIMLYIATTGSALLGFAVLFVFALGLGTLFLLIGTFSSAITALPNAGVWMESVKQFFGFVLLLMALYFMRTIVSSDMLALLTGLLLLIGGIFVGAFDRLVPESTFFPRLKKTLGILAVVIGLYLFGGYLLATGLIWQPVRLGDLAPSGTTASVTLAEKIPWITNLTTGLKSASQSGRPAVIDTWATWCANCYKLDRHTWSDDRVAAEIERFVPMKLQLEEADSRKTKDFLRTFDLKQYSLPTIILLDSTGKVARVLQGYLGPEDMLAELRRVS